MIIPGQFGFNCPSGFREEAFLKHFSHIRILHNLNSTAVNEDIFIKNLCICTLILANMRQPHTLKGFLWLILPKE